MSSVWLNQKLHKNSTFMTNCRHVLFLFILFRMMINKHIICNYYYCQQKHWLAFPNRLKFDSLWACVQQLLIREDGVEFSLRRSRNPLTLFVAEWYIIPDLGCVCVCVCKLVNLIDKLSHSTELKHNVLKGQTQTLTLNFNFNFNRMFISIRELYGLNIMATFKASVTHPDDSE